MPDIFYRNPWLRALIPLLCATIVGVASSALVVEVASGQDVDWAAMPKKASFYVVFICILIACFYQVKLTKRDNELLKGFTAKQYEACIRNRVAEDVAKRSRKLINEGKIDQLVAETDAFKKLFGEEKK
ncbi:hypothetical protein ACK33V_13555 [Aeromonas veronii]|uniref:hypothetical protein n=1 Tax=Aeromonas veronii TaxID=654 RepID=UPI00222ED429|nr:hypothetical protein [Aeromonas veronii]EKP0300687.1 hypothetical protein [Aeromonas veronii]EKP0301991.1 hypothetical protein [Aeromonas veronii]UZE59275.1 hypothetical protein ONR73_20955 [Aeromonas veronii]